ncbi:hypothetical protein [Nonomuraea glycinis]|uniref:hypothetical protein n=1 Tax=Nonomuraea glycinis TaxID=2047744 RepID=UPI002E0FBE60|nr:hypothetical protein OHA68_33450 [Nonomuraea glycinis]
MHLQSDLARRASQEPASSPHRAPAEEAYRHPYGGDRRQTPRRARLAVIDVQDETMPPPQEPETHVNERLQQIREISHRAIGSIDDLLQRTA